MSIKYRVSTHPCPPFLVPRYIRPYLVQMQLVFMRQARLLARNKHFLRARVVQCLVMGLVTGSLFSGTSVFSYQSTMVTFMSITGTLAKDCCLIGRGIGPLGQRAPEALAFAAVSPALI